MISERKKPIVKLISITKDPIKVIAFARDISDQKVIPLVTNDISNEYALYTFRKVLSEYHQTPLEYINTVWYLDNVSRAFQQQLTRHRIGFSFNIQSMRYMDAGNFAKEMNYHMPGTVKDVEKYHQGMLVAEKIYRDEIESGETVEDARGHLPMNVFSPISMACSYRALIGLVKQRMCCATQGEWKDVVIGIRFELEKINPVLIEPFDCLCGRVKNGKGFCKVLKIPVDKYGNKIGNKNE